MDHPKKRVWLGALLVLCALALAADAPLAVTVAPERVWIVEGDGVRKINFDFLVANSGAATTEIVELKLVVRDRNNDFVLGRELNRQGMIPSILSLVTTEVGPGKVVQLLNPFSEFPRSVDPALLEYTLVFAVKAAAGAPEPAPVEVKVEVRPMAFRPVTRLALPLKGRVFVIDGHDFMAHHRRIDMTHPLVVQLGMKHNISRYGMDFVVVDAEGRHFKGDGAGLDDYYVFGRPVLAPAAGVVADCIEGRADNRIGEFGMDYDELMRTRDLRLFGGNFVVLDHGAGEFTFFAHLQKGSLAVKPGDRVVAGQELGRVGNSGDSFWPHLHFQVMSGARFDCEQLPAVFAAYTLFRGRRSFPVANGTPDTGDLVESGSTPVRETPR
jgi:hypothetical protein